MKVLGTRANMCLFVYPVIFVVAVLVCYYFGSMIVDYSEAVINDDYAEMQRLGELIDKYTISRRGRRNLGLNPSSYTISSLLLITYSIFAFNRRLVQPRVLIEKDDNGFYLNLPFSKTWYVLYEEILCIDVHLDENRVKIPKYIYRPRGYVPIDPDGFLTVTNSTFGLLKTGTIKVGLHDRTIKVHGVKNALEVAKQMQTICNDGKRKRDEWLEEKAWEKREKELREKTKT